MAGEADIFAALGNDDLAAFSQQLTARSVPGQLGNVVNSFKFDNSTWSPKQSATTAFLQGLIGGGLNQYAKNDHAQQLEKVVNIIPQLYSDPMGAIAPEGVDAGAFAELRGASALKGLQRKALLEANKQGLRDQAEIQLEVEKQLNPWKFSQGDGGPTPNYATEGGKTVEVDPLDAILSNGKESTNQRRSRLFQNNLKQGFPPTQAATAAKDEVQAEINQNSKGADKAAEAREYANKLTEMAARSEQAFLASGETGPGDTIRGAQLWARSFVDPEAKERLSGRQIFDSIKADLVNMKKSPGSVTENENRMILAGGPGTDKTLEANRTLIANWKELAQANYDYADFLETYKEKNRGSIVGADKLWTQYSIEHPLYKSLSTGVKRPSWQEYFTEKATGGSVVAATPDVAAASQREQAIAELKRRGKI